MELFFEDFANIINRILNYLSVSSWNFKTCIFSYKCQYASIILFVNNFWLEFFSFTLRIFIFSRSGCIANELLRVCFSKDHGFWYHDFIYQNSFFWISISSKRFVNGSLGNFNFLLIVLAFLLETFFIYFYCGSKL